MQKFYKRSLLVTLCASSVAFAAPSSQAKIDVLQQQLDSVQTALNQLQAQPTSKSQQKQANKKRKNVNYLIKMILLIITLLSRHIRGRPLITAGRHWLSMRRVSIWMLSYYIDDFIKSMIYWPRAKNLGTSPVGVKW